MATNLLSRAEAARLTGASLRTVDRWRKDGKLTTYRNRRGAIRIDPEELDRLSAYQPASAGTEG